MCDAFTVDGRWITSEMDVLFNCADDGQRAYLLNGANQYYSEEDKAWHQPISEIDFVPLPLRVKSKLADGFNDEADTKKISDDIFVITSEKAQAEEYTKAEQNSAWNKIMWIISIVCGTLLLICGVIFIWG